MFSVYFTRSGLTGVLLETWMSTILIITCISSLNTTNAQRGPGPRAGHCIVEHAGVVYVLGGTPPISSQYANFTSLKLPQNNLWSINPDEFPWVELTSPPVSVNIPSLTMTYNTQAPTATPSWTDCFATDSGLIVVVGGSAQLLVYDIGSTQWSQLAGSIKFGPSVSSGMFLNPVYIQSRILGDGKTGLVVCTLNWNSQPQPYYLDTTTWTVTLAIGTLQTTPPNSPGSSNGWGVIPGGGPLLPPNGFRHFSLVVLDKTAYIMGGYSTLLTGQISDWSSVTSFPVQQAPSSTVVMFGNAGDLAVKTRGSVAYPISDSTVHILAGNRGGNPQGQQLVQTYVPNQVIATSLTVADQAPKNLIFRGATLIGRGGNQIFTHGGLTTLEFGNVTVPPTDYLSGGAAVWNGDSQTWGNMASVYVPPKRKGLMIGLIVGGVVLLVLIGVGIWYYKRRQRRKIQEEEEREAKGLVLKNEDLLQKEHKPVRSFDENSSARPTPAIAYFAAHPNGSTIGGSETAGAYQPVRSTTPGYAETYATGRGTSSEAIRRSPYQEFSQTPLSTYAQPELVDEDYAVQTITDSPRYPKSPQDYSSFVTVAADSPAILTTSNDGLLSRAPSRYQTVVSTTGHPVYGMPSDQVSKQEYYDSAAISVVATTAGTLSMYSNPYHEAALTERSSFVLPDPSAQQNESHFGTRPYSEASTANLTPSLTDRSQQMDPYSPTFSVTYSQPGSAQGSNHNDEGTAAATANVISKVPSYPPPPLNNQTRP